MHSLAAVSVLAVSDAQHQPPVELQQIDQTARTGFGISCSFSVAFRVALPKSSRLSSRARRENTGVFDVWRGGIEPSRGVGIRTMYKSIQ
jgi:hypothetical protein